MASTISSAENITIDAGTKLLMELNGLSVKMYSYFIGMIKGRYILTQIPISNEHSKDQIFQFLYPQNKVTVRFIQDGAALGFTSELIKYTMSPFPMLFLNFPSKIETYELRKHRRLNCLFQASAHFGECKVKSMITDLSHSGCQVIIPADVCDQMFAIDDVIIINCAALLSKDEIPIEGRVMRIQKTDQKYSIGIKFKPLDADVAKQIKDFVADAKICLL